MLPFFKKRQIDGKDNNLQKIPLHIAIIMDGNSRWARTHGFPTQIGHKNGAENVAKITEASIKFGVKFLTLYAFSSENWQRPKEEVDNLMNLLNSYLDSESENFAKKNVRILISGDLSMVEKSLIEKIKKVQDLTQNNSAITLNVAFSYGGRQEIVDAAKRIVGAFQEGKISIEQINENLFAQNLYQPHMPDPDLLIRTAGDLRLSNFLLWQAAYSELYFTPKFWPEFDQKELEAAIYEFNLRERNYGTRKSI